MPPRPTGGPGAPPYSLIGTKAFHLSAGKSAVVSVPLNGLGKRLVRKAKRRGVTAKLTGKGLRGRTITLKAGVSKRHRKKS